MKTFLAILAIIPGLIEVITSVEKAFPQSGKGAEKLALIKSIMAELYAGITEQWGTIEKVVNAIVAFANKIGAFSTNK